MDDMTGKLLKWATERGIMEADNADKQLLKVVEEVGELSAAYNKHDGPKFYDSVGDTLVTVYILALQCGIYPEAALASAYDEIKGRKGKTVDGVFIKEKDLTKQNSSSKV